MTKPKPFDALRNRIIAVAVALTVLMPAISAMGQNLPPPSPLGPPIAALRNIRLLNGPFNLAAAQFSDTRAFVQTLLSDPTAIHIGPTQSPPELFDIDNRGIKVGFLILDRPMPLPASLSYLNIRTLCATSFQDPSLGTVEDLIPPGFRLLDMITQVDAITQIHGVGNVFIRYTGGWQQIAVADLALLPPGPVAEGDGLPPPYPVELNAVWIYAYYYQPTPQAPLSSPEIANASHLDFSLVNALDLVPLPSGSGAVPTSSLFNGNLLPRPGLGIYTFDANDPAFNDGPLGPSFVLRSRGSAAIPLPLNLITVPSNTVAVLTALVNAPFD